MNLKKVITWLVVAFVVFYVIQAPESSAQLVRNAGEALGDAASSLVGASPLRPMGPVLPMGRTGPPVPGRAGRTHRRWR